MLLNEFDAEKYERTIRGEGLEEGVEIGTKIGTEIGIERANRLTQILLEQNRTDDLTRAVRDKEYQEQLFREFNL